MTTADPASVEVVEAAAPVIVAGWRQRLAAWWRHAGDRLNPILVKETRQALKSRQFTMTFVLLLICAWIWSIVGVAMIGPAIHYAANGPEMFYGYFATLCFPLLVVVPFAAFRSLAVEREEQTFELLSITTLRPRQIVAGKLGSAVLQMLLYLSALAPCLAFTYMLRGIDFPTILLMLGYAVFASLGLSVLSLLAATLTRERHLQIVLSLGLIIGLLWLFFVFVTALFSISALAGWQFRDPDFWLVNAGLFTGYVSYFVLAFFAASSQLTFASDNRSTALRLTMAVQQLLCVGWFAWIWLFLANGELEALFIMLVLAFLHWSVAGVFLVGESPHLSPRVLRSLPRSFMGRTFLTWFNPGPGTGYMLVGVSLATLCLLCSVGVLVVGVFFSTYSARWNADDALNLCGFAVLGTSYIMIYLGLTKLFVALVRRYSVPGILLAPLVAVLLLMIGCGIPLTIQLSSPALRDLDYTLLQITNVFWSLAEVGSTGVNLPEFTTLMICIPSVAVVIMLLNLPSVIREVEYVRIKPPKRVLEEEAEQQALKAPPVPQRTSPWG